MKTLFIIDGNSLIYRAFFAVPPFSTSKGLTTNAVFGFTKMLIKLIKDKKPDFLSVVFDAKGPTFRTALFDQYKAQRPKMPDQLVEQKPYIREMVEGFGIPILEIEGFEADDVIGTLIKKFEREAVQVVMVTGDKDLMQFVLDGKVVLYDTMKDVIYGSKEVKEKMGVHPHQIIDLLSLMGDSSDNIPGVRGIGPKTALKLLEKYQNLNNVYQHLEEIEGSVHDKLKLSQELAFLSYKLATIKTDIDLKVSLEDLKTGTPDLEKLNKLCDLLEFKSIKKDLAMFGTFDTTLYEGPKKVHEKRYMTIKDKKMFDNLLSEIKNKKEFALDTETTSLDPFQAELAGVSLSCNQNIGYYVPVGHQNYKDNLDKKYVIQELFKLLEEDSIRKSGHNMKFDLAILLHQREALENTGTGKPKKKGQMNLF